MLGIEYMILKVPLYMDVISFISIGPINATQRSHVSLTVHFIDRLVCRLENLNIEPSIKLCPPCGLCLPFSLTDDPPSFVAPT
jgi:hypothetical protein